MHLFLVFSLIAVVCAVGLFVYLVNRIGAAASIPAEVANDVEKLDTVSKEVETKVETAVKTDVADGKAIVAKL